MSAKKEKFLVLLVFLSEVTSGKHNRRTDRDLHWSKQLHPNEETDVSVSFRRQNKETVRKDCWQNVLSSGSLTSSMLFAGRQRLKAHLNRFETAHMDKTWDPVVLWPEVLVAPAVSYTQLVRCPHKVHRVSFLSPRSRFLLSGKFSGINCKDGKHWDQSIECTIDSHSSQSMSSDAIYVPSQQDHSSKRRRRFALNWSHTSGTPVTSQLWIAGVTDSLTLSLQVKIEFSWSVFYSFFSHICCCHTWNQMCTSTLYCRKRR